MSAIFFWIFFSLVLLTVCPDPRQARYEIAKRQAEARRASRKATRAP
jgi:hypothetical protein